MSVMGSDPCGIRNLYKIGMPLAQENFYVGAKLIKKFFPILAKHMAKENLDISMYATQWFMTIFTNSFPFSFVTLVWDIFLAEVSE